MRAPLLAAASALLVACSASAPPDVRPAESTAAPTHAPPPPAPEPTKAATTASAAPEPSASPAAPPPPANAEAPEQADNQVKPISDSEELQARAKDLLDAIAKDDAPVGDPFWFPKPPFLPLKDIKDPGKYWEQLHRTYGSNIHALHAKRTSWDGVKFVRFEIGSAPKWVKPGEEANKIGYYRSFHGLLHYEIDGKSSSIDVHTVITWQGRWYVTHLSKFK